MLASVASSKQWYKARKDEGSSTISPLMEYLGKRKEARRTGPAVPCFITVAARPWIAAPRANRDVLSDFHLVLQQL